MYGTGVILYGYLMNPQQIAINASFNCVLGRISSLRAQRKPTA